MEQSSPGVPESPISAQNHGYLWLPRVRVGAQVPQLPMRVPCTPTCCIGGSSRAGWEVKPGGYFDHKRSQKLPVAEHRSQTLVLELINLARKEKKKALEKLLY